jgi:hypothetical protein
MSVGFGKKRKNANGSIFRELIDWAPGFLSFLLIFALRRAIAGEFWSRSSMDRIEVS